MMARSPSLEQEISMKTILVGYDQTDPSERALERALELAKAFEAKILITSVARVMADAGTGRSMGGLDPTDSPEEHAAEMQSAAERVKTAGLTAELVRAIGDPAEAIVKAAEQYGADLIVVGARERGWMQRMLDHSVSQDVARHARCDVLIVH
jgi:nucleotide-binding universal stress UspA family protein